MLSRIYIQAKHRKTELVESNNTQDSDVVLVPPVCGGGTVVQEQMRSDPAVQFILVVREASNCVERSAQPDRVADAVGRSQNVRSNVEWVEQCYDIEGSELGGIHATNLVVVECLHQNE